ncbi:type 2 isopentenyl-diphosphate Delta-isomerase [Pseudomonas viridiflava]|uniref:Isopentenyl-diphosphate delta-isomerase n=4 Tax=Pseudomonas viridiflava TaxID=33069 RepID=A0AA46VZ92_PSEVI|nr:type 2 isopentenyl-diphosphate Delta-isomerase [Pseudomonas viridiflava]MCQ9390053.1 type 2 isopentenyl-diphosphate Delta-isomerase [Pseudomonas viridiflava]PCK93168.1 type 2 isopentenyl-diphosphate Delta-isomerase [Pseudomonas viridiflava]UZA69169.1 type 2 isopentenyl-diphosphate Delta-isomerase [Pseudomonas viridiflava]
MDNIDLSRRKDDHLDIVLKQSFAGSGTGLEAVRFEHCALPELNLGDIDLSSSLLGIPLRAPLLISSMTGGAERSTAINRHLAQAAQRLGIAMGVGSQRVGLRSPNDQGLTRELRRLAPDIPLLSNIGAAQLLEADGLDLARRAVDALQANALIIHLNPLQEAVQAEGDKDWRGVLDAIASTVERVGVPVIVKEVGAGLSAPVARALVAHGVQVLDVAGKGGTSWAAIEGERATRSADREVAMAFADWGIPTATSLINLRQALPHTTLIASGGIRNGIDAARAIRLGADLVGQAAGVLNEALESDSAVIEHFETIIRQLRIVCFCTGSRDLAALREARLLDPIPSNERAS